jgi:hypothetical protein
MWPAYALPANPASYALSFPVSNLCLVRFSVLFPQLTIRMGSLVWLACLLLSNPRRYSPQLDFHVQLFYLCRTSDWESFFSRIRFALNPKSHSVLLRSASFNSD